MMVKDSVKFLVDTMLKEDLTTQRKLDVDDDDVTVDKNDVATIQLRPDGTDERNCFMC